MKFNGENPMQRQRKDVISLSMLHAMLHAGNAIYMAFIPLFLVDLNFDPAQRGVLMSIGPFVAMLTQTMWGSVSDRAKNKVRVVYIMALGVMVSMAGFLLAGKLPSYATVFVATAMMMYAFFQTPIMPVLDTVTMEYIHKERPRIPYGVIRTMGTIAYVVAALVIGRIVDASDMGVSIAFYIYLIFLAVMIVAALVAPPIAGTQREKQKASVVELLKDKWFVLLIMIAFVAGTANGFHSSNFVNYLRDSLGADESMVGFATSMSAELEIFIFIIIHKITKKTGIINLVLMCIIAGLLRWFCTGTITSVPVLIMVQLLFHPLACPILIYVMAVYIQKAVPDQLHARGQVVVSLVMTSIGRIVGSLGGGWLLGKWGMGSEPYVYFILTAATAVLLVFVVVMFWRYGWRPNREPDALRLEEDTVI